VEREAKEKIMKATCFDRDNMPYDTAQNMATLGQIADDWPTIKAKAQEIIAANRSREDAGEVAVWWEGGRLHLRYRGIERAFRGAAVEGCDASDEFVQRLADELVADRDADMPAETR
jgi:hypothetical protein